MSRARILLPLACACALSACGIGQRPSDELYVLKAEGASSGKAIPLSIRVEQPEVDPGLDSARIAVMDTPNHLTFYNGVAWAQALPDMMQQFFIDAFDQRHAFKNVSSDSESIETADALLITDIRDFEVDKSGQGLPVIKIRMVVKLVNAGNHRIMVTIPVEKTVTAEANHMPDLVRAFNVAANQVADEIIAKARKNYGKVAR